MHFIRYHKPSGAIDIQVTTHDDENLTLHSREDHRFLCVDSELEGPMWVQGDKLLPQTDLGIHTKIRLAVGEPFTVSNLPVGAWIKKDMNLPQMVREGSFTGSGYADARMAIFALVGPYRASWVVEWVELEDLKTRACDEVDAKAEQVRGQTVTQGDGQARTYQIKAEAAAAFIKGEKISASKLLLLQADATRLNVSVMEAAVNIQAKNEKQDMREAQIEVARLQAKSDIRSANWGREIQSILDNVAWPA